MDLRSTPASLATATSLADLEDVGTPPCEESGFLSRPTILPDELRGALLLPSESGSLSNSMTSEGGLAAALSSSPPPTGPSPGAALPPILPDRAGVGLGLGGA